MRGKACDWNDFWNSWKHVCHTIIGKSWGFLGRISLEKAFFGEILLNSSWRANQAHVALKAWKLGGKASEWNQRWNSWKHVCTTIMTQSVYILHENSFEKSLSSEIPLSLSSRANRCTCRSEILKNERKDLWLKTNGGQAETCLQYWN